MTNWTAIAKCSLSIDTTIGFTGVSFPPQKQALKVTCTSTGTVQFGLTNPIPVSTPQGLAWGFHVTSATTGLVVNAQVDAKDGLNNTVNTGSAGQTIPAGAANQSWVPVAGNTSTNNLTGGPTTHGMLTVSCAMTSGQVIWIDTVGVFASVGQVLIDFNLPPLGQSPTAGNQFADVTGRVKFDSGINIATGRQDEFSDVQTGNAGFDLQNDDGWFSTKNNASPWYPGNNNPNSSVQIGKRVQINATDEQGVWYTRFDGQISEFDYTIDPIGGTNVNTINCNDVLGMANRQIQLPCWTKALVLSEPSLLYHWTLDDQGLNGLAAETSGNNGPPLRQKLWGPAGTAAINWQGSAGGVETLADALVNNSGNALALGPQTAPLSTVNFSPLITTGTGQDDFVHNSGYALQAQLPNGGITPNATGEDFTLECWFTMDPTLINSVNADTGPFIVLGLGDSRDGYNISFGLHTQITPNDFNFIAKGWKSSPGFAANVGHGSANNYWTYTDSSWVSDIISFPHHLAVVFTGSATGATVSMYIDGVVVASGPTLAKNRVYDWISVGAAFGGYGNWFGDISLVSIYNSALSATTIANHTAMGQTATYGYLSDSAIELLAQLAGIPTYWNSISGGNGLTHVEYFDITGNNALTAMQQYEQMERGFLFVDTNGQLVFHTRDWRMGYGAPDLTIPTNIYTPDMGLATTDQYLVNIAAYASAIFTSGTEFEDVGSVAQYGPYSNGTAQSPNSIPLPSFSPGVATLGVSENAYWSDPYLDDLASWTAATTSQPQTKVSSLTVDTLTLDDTAALHLSDFYSLHIDNMITLAGLPNSMPTDAMANDYFIEGWAETISQQARTIQFYTTPAIGQRAWIPGDSAYGKLDATAMPGISQASQHANAPLGKKNDYDPGPPYWAPTFSTTMNNPANNGHEFVGMNDLRGLVWPLQNQLSPPITVVGQQLATQSVPNNTGTTMQWDIVFTDNIGAMGFIPHWPNWYCCLQNGFYEVSFSIVWTQNSAGGTHHKRAKAVVAQKGAQQQMLGIVPSGDMTQSAVACSFKSDVASNASNENDINTVSNQLYLGVGDMISVQLAQDSGGALTIGGDYGGSMLSVRWLASGTTNDQWT